jgi:hypothetical protein
MFVGVLFISKLNKDIDYWNNKLELTKTPVTKKRKINNYFKNDVDFLSFLVGLIDGDGYIFNRFRKNGYIESNLIITFHNRDIKTFEYILNKLGFGTILKVNKDDSKYVIYNFELRYILVPLLIRNNLYFLTKTRSQQYNVLLYIIENNIKKWENFPTEIPNYNSYNLNDSSEILNLWFFRNWLVGFVVSEGSFFIQENNEFYFSIGQKGNKNLMKAISLLFEIKRLNYENILNDVTIVRMSSKEDIQKVINFFSFEKIVSLTGYKKEQYDEWLKKLKVSKRYKNLKYPT